MRHDDVVDAIGHTPLVRLRLPAGQAELYAKLELQNLYAMKDRVARQMLRSARAAGLLRPGAPIIESSSGSMALGLALVGRALGHPVHIVTDPRIDPLTMAKLKALGCAVYVVDKMGAHGWQGARLDLLAELLATMPDAFWLRQYTNPDNPSAYAGLAEELLADLGRVDVLVGSVGTGGSLCGAARTLRLTQPQPVRVVAVDSVGSVLFDQPDRPGRLQSGLGNSLRSANVDRAVIDEIHWLNDREAFEATMELATEQQLFAGNTSGSVYRVARYLAGQAPAGTRIVAVLPDRGDRYVHTIFDEAYLRERGVTAQPRATAPSLVPYGEPVRGWSFARLSAGDGGARMVFVESNTTGTGMRALVRAREQGLVPVLVTEDPSRYRGLAETGAQVVRADTADAAALATAVGAQTPLAGITTTSDFYTIAATRLASAAGFPANPPQAVARCRDKSRTRRALTRAGLAQPLFAVVERIGDVAGALESVGLPCVVKPAEGSASEGVRLCETPAEASDHAALLLRRTHNVRGQPIRPRVLIEQLLAGAEFSVETMGLGDDVVCLGITAKRLGPPPWFVETGHHFPAPLPAATRAILVDLTTRTLKALGLTLGPAHTEVRLTADGPVVVEVNPRLAGGLIPELVRRATGVDLLAQQIAQACGRVPDLVPTLNRHAGIRFILAPRTGRLRDASGIDVARRVPGVVNVHFSGEPGAPVAPARDGYGRLGHIMAEGDDETAVTDALDAATAAVSLLIDSPGRDLARVGPADPA
ncbi:hypothetical protein Aph01nite_35870 [Acrocarpospora phusangensis]|uniref:ATP-grasp domain-containing protein n=1 Tax=Acrocarpospora phusangensis TaxID=1070424 RepID=A0A919UP54_9ACTN|nr:pyridoxal-phosphate dependent enzyme [Acrocarpospora phusangensis]GIH25277.1 hypothetical protein Aph01nite_35870 [Acrocarpospora phusangensis]